MKKEINNLTEKEKKRIIRAGKINDALNNHLTKIMPVPFFAGVLLIVLYAFGLKYSSVMIWGMSLLVGSCFIPVFWLIAIYIAAAGSHGNYSYPLYKHLVSGEDGVENTAFENMNSSLEQENDTEENEGSCEIEECGGNSLKLTNELARLLGKLNMTEEEVLNAKKNPCSKIIKIYLSVLVAVIIIPLLMVMILKNSGIIIFGMSVEKILYAIPILGSTLIAVELGPKLFDYSNFKRAKRILQKGESNKKSFEILPRISMLGCVFLLFAVINLVIGISEAKELKYYQQNGVAVTASVYKVDRVENGDNTDYYVYFTYEYDNKKYTWCEDGSDYREGDIITAYISPETPETLFIYEGSFFFVFFFLIISAFFFWMENGFPQGFSIFGIFESSLMVAIGLIYGMNVWTGWGIFFIILSLIVFLFGIIRKKSTKKTAYLTQ